MEDIGFDVGGGFKKNHRMGGGGGSPGSPHAMPPYYGKTWINDLICFKNRKLFTFICDSTSGNVLDLDTTF